MVPSGSEEALWELSSAGNSVRREELKNTQQVSVYVLSRADPADTRRHWVEAEKPVSQSLLLWNNAEQVPLFCGPKTPGPGCLVSMEQLQKLKAAQLLPSSPRYSVLLVLSSLVFLWKCQWRSQETEMKTQ